MSLLRLLLVFLLPLSGSVLMAKPADDAARYAQAIERINEAHARQPGKTTEDALAAKLPPDAKSALKRVLEAKPSPDLAAALGTCAEAALDLALAEDFGVIAKKLGDVSPDAAARYGAMEVRPRFLVRGIGDFAPGYLDRFADVFDAILKAYDEVFGFAEWSKVPGKKLRIRVHLEQTIQKPPHFAPEFRWHSEIDFPVIDREVFRSPTRDGQFLFYGLCHELGHVVAMWGDLKTMEDWHAWAHYTGVVIVDHMAASAKDQPWMQELRDVRWRSLKLERDLPENKTIPSLKSKGAVMALLMALHDSIGPPAIGAALNWLDAEGKSRRINRVRYYQFAGLRRALAATLTDPAKKKTVLELLK